MRFSPAFLDLRSGTVALVGSGPVALNTLRLLRAAGVSIRWYAASADVAEEVRLANLSSGRFELSFADPLHADFSEFVAVVVATGGPLDESVAARARASHVPVNVVDRPDLSMFTVPAAAGRDSQTPVGMFARDTHADMTAIVGALGDLPALAQQAGQGPALLVVGDVVARSDGWRAT